MILTLKDLEQLVSILFKRRKGKFIFQLIEEIANEVLFGRQLEYTVKIKPSKPHARNMNRNSSRNNEAMINHCTTNGSLLSELLIKSSKSNERRHKNSS